MKLCKILSVTRIFFFPLFYFANVNIDGRKHDLRKSCAPFCLVVNAVNFAEDRVTRRPSSNIIHKYRRRETINISSNL